MTSSGEYIYSGIRNVVQL